MALPKLEIPTFTVTLPDTGVEVKYRPYLVKESKALMFAATSKPDTKDSTKMIYNSCKDIIEACTFGKVKPDDLSVVDFESLFFAIKSKSTGEAEPQMYKCNNEIIEDEDVEDALPKRCGTSMPLEIKLDAVKLSNEIPEKKIKINDSLTFVMKLPTMGKSFRALLDKDNINEYEIVADCIDMIIYEEDVHSDFTKEEMVEFLDQFTDEQLKGVVSFFKDTPSLEYKTILQCPSCKYKHEIHLKGLQSFFG